MFIFVFTFFLIVSFILIYKRVYFRPISVVYVSSSKVYSAVPILPNPAFFKSFSSGAPFSLVSLGNRYVALYSRSDSLRYRYNNVSLPSDFYVFRIGKFGKLVSVDLSDRCLNDILNKLNEVSI